MNKQFDLLTSRSEIIAADTCKRLRLLGSLTGPTGLGSVGIGWVPTASAIPLAKGSMIHLGLQRLLESASVDEAVADATAEFTKTVKDRGFSGVLEADQAYTYAEQKALGEVVIRLWAAKRLPLLLSQYEVLEIEREAPIVELAPGIGFQSRPDGVLRNKQTGFLEVLSFKSASTWRKEQDETNENDVQGISETWAVAQKYGPVASVLMEYLILGQQKGQGVSVKNTEDESEIWVPSKGPKLQDSPLVRPWRVGEGKYAFKGKVALDGKTFTLGKYFDPAYGLKGKARAEMIASKGEFISPRVAIWEEMPLKEWCDKLLHQEVFPEWEDSLNGLFIGKRYTRHAQELVEWQREAAAQEYTILYGKLLLENLSKDPALGEFYKMDGEPSTIQEVLDEYFPRSVSRKPCHSQYGQRCQFYSACWLGEQLGASLKFTERKPNHPLVIESDEGEE